jgi:hypothetical protein
MKKQLILFCMLLFTASAVNAQYPLRWVKHYFINPASDVTRGAAYNPATDHVLVASRYYGKGVFVLDAATGDSLMMMDSTGISGGTYSLNLVDVDDDGVIYVCNLSAPQFTPGSELKIYRFTNEQASPEVVFSDALDGERYGDAFNVTGSGDNTYIYASGQKNPKMVVLTNSGGSFAVDSYIDLPIPGNARHGISPVSPGGKVWVNGADDGAPAPSLLAPDGTLIASVPDTIISPGGSSTVLNMNLGRYNLVSVINAYGGTVSSARYFEDEIGTVTFDYFGDNYFSNPEDTTALYYKTGQLTNINASGTLSYDSKRNSLIVLYGWNSIASLSLDSLVNASTPRDDFWTISVDGVLDFFPTDHVGVSNGRDMYLTWASGKFFVGVTGHTLVDPTETNFMYVAFDLDPGTENGTTTPPTEDGGVQSLPFPADVVIMAEPWTEPDYLIGSIFKWNGSSWEENLFDGNLASQGALAYADEGEGKLAEISAIRNEAGIGTDYTDISVMVYVAEKGSEGGILSAFPGENPTVNGAEFGMYYYIPELGAGMYPTDTTYVKVRGEPATSISESIAGPAKVYELSTNYPNPFNPSTKIELRLNKAAEVDLTVYDLRGREVTSLLSGNQKPGSYELTFDGGGLSSGVYFYTMKIDGRAVQTHKMLLIK